MFMHYFGIKNRRKNLKCLSKNYKKTALLTDLIYASDCQRLNVNERYVKSY